MTIEEYKEKYGKVVDLNTAYELKYDLPKSELKKLAAKYLKCFNDTYDIISNLENSFDKGDLNYFKQLKKLNSYSDKFLAARQELITELKANGFNVKH